MAADIDVYGSDVSENSDGTNVRINDSDVSWNSDNSNYENKIKNLQAESERRYISLVESIVEISGNQLANQNENKKELRNTFQWFFIVLLSFQMLALVAVIAFSALFDEFNVSDNVIITFITSVFVETLGAIGIMIKFAFDSEQEVKILEILNGAIKSFQKFTKS